MLLAKEFYYKKLRTDIQLFYERMHIKYQSIFEQMLKMR